MLLASRRSMPRGIVKTIVFQLFDLIMNILVAVVWQKATSFSTKKDSSNNNNKKLNAATQK